MKIILFFLLIIIVSKSQNLYEPWNKSVASVDSPLTLLWEPGQEIWIKFIGGSKEQRRKVITICQEWTEYANLKFVFVSSGYSHARIGFSQEDGHWSYIGRRSTLIDQNSRTMNIALNSHHPSTRWNRVVLHEFGHLLGLAHEHQNPCGNPIRFTSYRDVIEYYKKQQGWSEAKTRNNVYKKLRDASFCWPFDPKSIMLYNLCSSIRKDNTKIYNNVELSTNDKLFVRCIYPPN